MEQTRVISLGIGRVIAVFALAAALLLGGRGLAEADQSMLHASGTNIVDSSGNTVQLRGVNLGGWLVIETWMTPADNSGLPDEWTIVNTLDTRFGVATEQSLIHTYRQNWLTTTDLDNIRSHGFNVVRVPVWWGDFFTLASDGDSSGWRADAFECLNWLVTNCAARGLYVIIDLHGVVGSQSSEQTTGQQGRNAYWSSSTCQSRTAWMWSQIAGHFQGNPTVAAYDVMNEPMGAPSSQAVWTAYNNLYNTIRSADADHMLIMEGTYGNWDWDMLPDPSTYGWTNVTYEMHEYAWGGNTQTVEAGAQRQVDDFNNHKGWNVPAYNGEFNDFGNPPACWNETARLYNNAAMNWSMWAYKAIHGLYPDSWGIYDPTYFATIPNLSNDSAATIVADWQQWQTSSIFTFNDQNPCPMSPLPGAAYTLTPACAPGAVLNAAGAGTTDGTAVNIWTANGGTAQQWVLIHTSGSMYQIAPSYDLSLRLDVSGAGSTDGTPVQLWTGDNTSAQQWFVTDLGNGTFTLSPECAFGSCLDVSGAGSADGTPVQIWTANGTGAQTWTMTAIPAVTSLTLKPSTVTSGNSATATLTLASPAPSSGLTVSLSTSDATRATVPATLKVAAGSASATFKVTTKISGTAATVTIGASTPNGSASALLTLNPTPARVSSLSITPASITGGKTATGTVVLNVTAPQNGLLVTLTSSNVSLASVPGSVVVPAGSTSATFPIATQAVSAQQLVNITATGGGTSKTRAMTILAPTVAKVTFNPSKVHGGASSTGTITLSGPVPPGGLSVVLTSNNAAVAVPGSVPIAAGATSVTFTANTTTVTATTTVSVTATLNGKSAIGKLTVTP